MSREFFEAEWLKIKGIIKEKWGKLTDDDLREINGRYDQFVAKLQQRYGYTRDEAEGQLRNWDFDRSRLYSNDRGHYHKDGEYCKTCGCHPWLKTLLWIGIPLLLLASYLAWDNAKHKQDAYEPRAVIEDERVTIEIPEDRVVSEGILNTLRNNTSIGQDTKNTIRINTENGVVTVRGVAKTAQERDAIVRSIEGVRGVKRVNNQIEVR